MSKDIKKALEHCIDNECIGCPNNEELGSGDIVCRARLLPEILEYISDLETKLSESEKKVKHWHNLYNERDKQFQSVRQRYHLLNKLKSNYDKKDKLHLAYMQCAELVDENEQLKQQLDEKEKRCEICGSKMILGELGYYCNNDELHPIYQAPNEAKSDYEKITLLKQDYDAMVEREELLRQQLAIEELKLALENFRNRPTYFDVARQEMCLSDQDKQFIDFINNRIKELGGGKNDHN